MREQTCFLEGSFHLTERDKGLLLSVSPSTIDRLLKADKKKFALKGKSGTKSGKLLKKQIPVRTYYANADKKPGFFEIDTVTTAEHRIQVNFASPLPSPTCIQAGRNCVPRSTKPINGLSPAGHQFRPAQMVP
jgi:hypothetical protein